MWGYHLIASLLSAPSPPIGPLLWLEADDAQVADGRVTAWPSRAPGEPVSLRAEPGGEPRWEPAGEGRRAVLWFDGRDDALRALEFGRAAETWTLLLVAAPAARARGGGLVSARSTDGQDYDPGFTVDLYGSAGAFEQLSVEGAGRQGGQRNQRTRGDPWGGLHLIVVERDATEIRLRVDGRAEGRRPVTPAVTRLAELRVGCRQYAGRERHHYHGALATVLLYDRILAADELARLEAAHQTTADERERFRAAHDARLSAREERRMQPPERLRGWPTVAAYSAEHPLPPVPRRDLREAAALGVHCLTSMFDADRDEEPYFYSNRREDGTGELLHALEIGIPHVVGRCLLGLAVAEREVGLAAPPEAWATLERYLRGSFDNPDHLNAYLTPDGRHRIELHNIREGLWGLWALIDRRDSAWAREAAHRALVALDRITGPDGRWSPELAARDGLAERSSGLSVPNAARAVEPLLALERATGDPLAGKLAAAYARAGAAEILEPDGRFAPMARSSGHVHSITSSLSGLAEYAAAAADEDLLALCRRALAAGVPDYFSSWGWGDEVYPDHPADEPGRGEINQTGDVLRTALILGEARDFALAERYLRSMVLPTQHREPELRAFLRDPPVPRGDFERDVLGRTIGGFAMQLPNDRMAPGGWPLATLDITSGAVHALAEAWRRRLADDGQRCRVNLLFDGDTPVLSVAGGLPLEGRLTLTLHQAREVAVRLPTGVTAADADGRAVPIVAGYAELGRLPAGARIALTFNLPCREEREVVDEVTYTTRWIGEQIVSIEPRGTVSPLPF